MSKKVFALNGSPRPAGNTVHLLQAFLDGARNREAEIERVNTHGLDLHDCTGCLRCNILKRCSLSGDVWEKISAGIMKSDVLVIASPVYFHHVPASIKRVLDRFRSFVHVQVTASDLVHTPHHHWNKDIVLILSLGSPDNADAQPVIDLFGYISRILGPENRLHVITGTGLAMVNHVIKTGEELKGLYRKLKLPEELAAGDAEKNAALIEECRILGKRLIAS